MLRRLVQLLIVCLIVVVLVACNQTPGPEVTRPFESVVNPLESPVRPGASEPVVVPTPASDSGVVTGQILDRTTGQVPLEGVVYLGTVLRMDNDKPVIRVAQDQDPFAPLDPKGNFVFSQVMPGEYAIVFTTPDESFLVDDPATGESIIFTVESGQVTDLGTIRLLLP